MAGIVKFEVAANPDQTAREGNVTVKYEYPDGKPQSFSVKVVQDAAPVPPPAPYDVELLDAKILTGIYYAGNITEDGNMYYFIHITDVGFDDDGYALPNGKFFRIGLISKEAPEDMNHIGLPVGTFRLGSGDGGIDTEEGYYLRQMQILMHPTRAIIERPSVPFRATVPFIRSSLSRHFRTVAGDMLLTRVMFRWRIIPIRMVKGL